jgi:hypothetical protein
MKHYFISGRIPGDDEDTGLSVGQHPNPDCAIAAYQRTMRCLGNWTRWIARHWLPILGPMCL